MESMKGHQEDPRDRTHGKNGKDQHRRPHRRGQETLLGLVCKNCGGTLELVDRTHAVCPFCGQRYLIDEAKGTVIHIQGDHEGGEDLRRKLTRTKGVLTGFLATAILLTLVIFGFNVVARRSVFSTSDSDIPAEAGGELLAIFCQDIFGKPFGEVSAKELGSVRYLRCSYEREGDQELNVIHYSFTDYRDCEDERAFQKTVEKWTYRTKNVSWPSDYSMFTGLTRIDTTGSTWLSMLHFSPDAPIRYVETEDSLAMVAQVLDPKAVEILHIGAAGISLEGIESFVDLEELKIDTTLASSSGPVDMSSIAACKHLKRLRLRCGGGYVGLDALKELPELTSLYIEDMLLGESDFLKELPGLEELSIYTGEEPDLTSLEPLKGLKRLYLVDQKYIPAQEIQILQGMPRLEELMIGAADPACLEEIAKLGSLRALDLHMGIFVYQVPTDVSPLAGLTHLERLQIDSFYGGTVTGIEPLLNLPDLVTFRLGRVASAPVKLALDPEALTDNPSIQELGFSTCRLEDGATGEALDFKFLAHYPGVRWLYLDDCGVTDVTFAEELEDLRGCSLKRDAIEDLSPLSGCKKLEVLCVDPDVASGVTFPPEVQIYTKVNDGIYGYSIFK